MSERLTAKREAEIRSWRVKGDADELIDELDAVRAERDRARAGIELLKDSIGRLQHHIANAERHGWEACREAAVALCRQGESDDVEGGICSWLAEKIAALRPPGEPPQYLTEPP